MHSTFEVNLQRQCIFSIADKIVNDIIEKAREVAEETAGAFVKADMADIATSEGLNENEAVKQDVEGNPQTEPAQPAAVKEAEDEKKDENAPENGKCS